MRSYAIIPILGAALASAQAPPPEVALTSTMSGVLPVLPTATPAPVIETEEGAIIYDGPANPGFTGQLGNATVQSNLPAATYEAVITSSDDFDDNTGSVITGTITGASTAGGSGVTFTVNFTGFPSEAMYGPFVYHIHNLAVPANGNCTQTLGHLDPTDRGEFVSLYIISSILLTVPFRYYPCDVTAPMTCQAGDLAGKHGNITGTSFIASFTDPYLSTDPSSQYYFGDKSVVIHSSNTTRLTCANFAAVSASNSTTLNATSPATSTPSVTPFTGAASTVSAISFAGALAGVVAMFML